MSSLPTIDLTNGVDSDHPVYGAYLEQVTQQYANMMEFIAQGRIRPRVLVTKIQLGSTLYNISITVPPQ